MLSFRPPGSRGRSLARSFSGSPRSGTPSGTTSQLGSDGGVPVTPLEAFNWSDGGGSEAGHVPPSSLTSLSDSQEIQDREMGDTEMPDLCLVEGVENVEFPPGTPKSLWGNGMVSVEPFVRPIGQEGTVSF